MTQPKRQSAPIPPRVASSRRAEKARTTRPPRYPPAVYPSPAKSPKVYEQAPPMEASLKRWLGEEVGTLQRLAHTQRLEGDYVAAQVLEQEIRWLTRKTAEVLRLEGTGKLS